MNGNEEALMEMNRKAYSKLYGPTVGDKVRLADTDLIIEIEKDFTVYGEEIVFDVSSMVETSSGRSEEHFDLVVTNVMVVDYSGIYKADIGIADGLIKAIGKAGNPELQPSVTIVISAMTDVISGEGLIATPGGVNVNAHFSSFGKVSNALSSGITTMIGGGSGPTTGSLTTGITTTNTISPMLKLADDLPVNTGFLIKANLSEDMESHMGGGALGIKLTPEWGSSPSNIDAWLKLADKYDVPFSFVGDMCNRYSSADGTLAAFKGRTVHLNDVSGVESGHHPDNILMAADPNVLSSSTSLALVYTMNSVESLRASMFCTPVGRISDDSPKLALIEQCISKEAVISAMGRLHDMGVIPMVTSSVNMDDSERLIARVWQLAHKNKVQQGYLEEDKSQENDNFRVRRYIAKYTINPAITYGVSDYVGSIEVGKLADLVLWEPAFFGVRPSRVIKGGVPVFHVKNSGPENCDLFTSASSSFMGVGKFSSKSKATFLSSAAVESGVAEKLDLQNRVFPAKRARNINKSDMVLHDFSPKINIDYSNFNVMINGEVIYSELLESVPLGRRYELF